MYSEIDDRDPDITFPFNNKHTFSVPWLLHYSWEPVRGYRRCCTPCYEYLPKGTHFLSLWLSPHWQFPFYPGFAFHSWQKMGPCFIWLYTFLHFGIYNNVWGFLCRDKVMKLYPKEFISAFYLDSFQTFDYRKRFIWSRIKELSSLIIYRFSQS